MMSSCLKSIQNNPNKIFQIPQKELRDSLEKATVKEVNQFLENISKSPWIKKLSKEDQSKLVKTVFLITPKHTKPEDFFDFFKRLESLKFRPPNKIDIQLARRTPNLIVEFLKIHMINEGSITEKKAYFLLSADLLTSKKLGDHEEQHAPSLFKYLLTKEISLTEKRGDLDLFDLALHHGNVERFIEIIDYYRSKMNESQFNEFINERMARIEEKRTPQEFKQIRAAIQPTYYNIFANYCWLL